MAHANKRSALVRAVSLITGRMGSRDELCRGLITSAWLHTVTCHGYVGCGCLDGDAACCMSCTCSQAKQGNKSSASRYVAVGIMHTREAPGTGRCWPTPANKKWGTFHDPQQYRPELPGSVYALFCMSMFDTSFGMWDSNWLLPCFAFGDVRPPPHSFSCGCRGRWQWQCRSCCCQLFGVLLRGRCQPCFGGDEGAVVHNIQAQLSQSAKDGVCVVLADLVHRPQASPLRLEHFCAAFLGLLGLLVYAPLFFLSFSCFAMVLTCTMQRVWWWLVVLTCRRFENEGLLWQASVSSGWLLCKFEHQRIGIRHLFWCESFIRTTWCAIWHCAAILESE